MATYDIVITKAEGAAPADGFIDQNKSQYYIDASADYPGTAALGQAKARANYRYKILLNKLAKLSPYDIVSITSSVATGDAAPNTFTIRVSFARAAADLVTISEASEPSPGTVLTGALAVERAVSRALTATVTLNLEWYDPTTTAAKGDNAGVTAGRYYGPRFESLVVGAVAANIGAADALVAVTLVP